jgi:N-acetylmuramoyl-L-alanine amidase
MKHFSVCLSPGHTPTNPGASRGPVTEYSLSSAIIGDMIFRLSKMGHIAHLIGSEDNIEQVKHINYVDPDFGLELHFNGHTDPAINGTMCLHAGAGRGVKLASAVNNRLVSMLGTHDKGCRKGHYRLDKTKPLIYMIRETNCPFILVEPLYLSNLDDFQKIDIPAISIAIVEGCVMYWEEVSA